MKLDKLGEVRGWVWSSQGSQAGWLGEGQVPPSPPRPARSLHLPCERGSPARLSLWLVLRWAQVLEESVRMELSVGPGQDPGFFSLQVFLV